MKINKLNESLIDKLNSLPYEKGISKVSYELIKEYQNILNQFPLGTVLKHYIDAGEEKFTKVEDGEFSWWEHFRAPWEDNKRISEFDLARWLASRGVISRSDIIEENLSIMKINKLNESTKFKVNDKVFVKPNKKQGRVLRVKGDYITVEMDNGKDPVRIDTYYDTDLEAVNEITESKHINESVLVDDEVVIGLYGDELKGGLSSLSELQKIFRDNDIKIKSISGDTEYGWDLEVMGNARDIHKIVNKYIPGYDCASTQEFVDRYELTESKSIKESISSDDKRKALANYLDVEVEDVVQTYDENNFEVKSTGEEYIVADYDDAYELAEQDVVNIIDDLGIDAFTPYFQEWIMDYAVKEDWFEDALAESQRYYYEDMDEDEFIEVCKENDISPDDENAIDELVDIYLDGIDDYVDEFKSIFGDSEFSTAVKENGLIDLDKVVEEAIRVDGIAHFIAGYDGEEIELSDDLFAYRTN